MLGNLEAKRNLFLLPHKNRSRSTEGGLISIDATNKFII